MKKIENLDGKIRCQKCGEVAHYQSDWSKKYWCSEHHYSCKGFSEMRKNYKNSGTRKFKKVDNPDNILCEGGCLEVGKFKSNRGTFWCCDNFSNCSSVRDRMGAKKGKGIIANKIDEKDIDENISCSYGCGQIALFVFENGVLSCSDHTMKCPTKREMVSEHFIEQWSDEDYKERHIEAIKKVSNQISESVKKVWEDQDSVFNSEEYRDKLRVTFTKRWEEDNFPHLKKLTIERIKKDFPLFYKIEKPVEIDGKIYVKCRNSQCQKLFHPVGDSIYSRLRALDKENEDSHGLYCSDECKGTCPLFGYKPHQDISDININKRVAIPNWLRKKVVELQEGKCLGCGNEISHETSTIHHIIPHSQNPFFELDIDNLIAFCNIKGEDGKTCHYRYGHSSKECNTFTLRKNKCFQEDPELLNEDDDNEEI